jgi:hypothetical protein
MVKTLLLVFLFEAYHYDKTADKGEDNRNEHKCREIHRPAGFKGTTANASYL